MSVHVRSHRISGIRASLRRRHEQAEFQRVLASCPPAMRAELIAIAYRSEI